MKAQKTPHWFKLLSAPVRASVYADVKRAGYNPEVEAELDSYVVDLFATAFRSPQGMIVRLKRSTETQGEAPAAEPDLFALPAAPPVPSVESIESVPS